MGRQAPHTDSTHTTHAPPAMSDDETEYIEESLSANDSQILSQQQSKASEINSLLNKGDAVGAVKAGLENPPTGTKNAEAKKVAADAVIAALAAVKDSEFDKLVTGLNADQQDVLMKYVYRALATPQPNAGSLLKLQGVLTEKAGLGCVVRVLADRRTV